MTSNNSNDFKGAPTFGLKEKVYWASASLGGSIVQGIYMSLLSIFYTDYLGLSQDASLILIITLIYTGVNAFNDPIFGFISDRTRSENGRRIPFMKYTVPLFTVSFILIWFSPDISAGPLPVFLWMLITTCLYDTSYTIIFMVYSALLPEITEDEQERGKLNVWAMFFNLIGQILGFLIPDFFRNQSKPLLWIAMIVVGIIGGLLILVTTFKFKERPEFTVVDEPLPLIPAIKHTVVNKSFLTLVTANFMGIFLQSMVVGSLFYLADYIVQTSTIIPMIFIFIPLLIGIWLTPKMIEKIGVVKSDQILLVIGGVGLIALTFMPNNILIYICLAIAGFGFVGPLIFTNILFAQVCDEDELQTGRRREAAFFGVNALITKPAQSLVIIIPGLMLSAAGFIPHALGTPPRLDQPAMVFTSIRLFIGLIPGIALLLGALILQFYPLKGKYWQNIQQKVLKLHAEKHKKYQEIKKNPKPKN
jgi:GPH family glycoside/pentoside/hexuronide:cation symporter